MTDPARPAARITNAMHDLVIDSRVMMNRASLHRLTTTNDELIDADHTERACIGDRVQAVTIMVSCAMDEAAEGDPVAAYRFLRAAVVTARRIDAARSEGRHV